MPQIDPVELRRRLPLRKGQEIIETFCHDTDVYPSEEVRMRRGVCKLLSEEYFPLVRLAEQYFCVRDVSLLSEGHEGPDAELRFWLRPSSKVQITCANEGYQRALLREQLAEGAQFSNQCRKRNKVTRRIESSGRVLSTSINIVTRRIQRIEDAIHRKSEKFYEGTDTLLIQDNPANFTHLSDDKLHKGVLESIRNGLGVYYRRIFIVYGNVVRRAK